MYKKLSNSPKRRKQIVELQNKIKFYGRLATVNVKHGTSAKWLLKQADEEMSLRPLRAFFNGNLSQRLFIYNHKQDKYIEVFHASIDYVSKNEIFVSVAFKEYNEIVAFETVKYSKLFTTIY